MEMVRHAIDSIERAFVVLAQAVDVGIEVALVFLCDDRLAVLWADDKVVEGIGVTHID